QKAWKSEDITAAEEVRALPDFEIEPLILEPGKLFLTKLMESDRKIEILFTKTDATIESKSFLQGLEELWTTIQQESLARKKCVRELDETLKKVEWSRTDKITDVLRKYTVMLEEISFFLPADIYRFINNEAMLINRALLANQRAISKLFFNLMKSEMKRELSFRLKWKDRVKNWKLTQKNYIVRSFREFVVNEEIQNPPAVKTEMETMINGQILLNDKRLEILQHLVYDRREYTVRQGLNVFCKYPVHLNLIFYFFFFKRDFEELAKQNEQNCRDLYRYFQEASSLWDVHQLELSKQEGELQKKLDECRQKQNKLIQMMENNLDIILHKMRTASSEKKLKKSLENSLLNNDFKFDRYETFNKVLVDKVTPYPEAILQELISYSVSISKYFNVKEIFKQVKRRQTPFVLKSSRCINFSLWGNFTSALKFLLHKLKHCFVEVLEAESLVEQQAESVVQENEENQKMDSSQQQNEETNRAENEEIFAWETEETEKQEDGERIFQESDETDDIEKAVSFSQVWEQELLKAMEVLHIMASRKLIRLCFFEHLEKWFAESLSNSWAIVAAKEEELNSELQQHLLLHQQRQENIETNIYNVRAAELLLHEKRLECHCAGVVEALNKERAEFLKFCDQQNDIIKNLNSQIHDIESVFLTAPMTEKLVSFSNSLHSELLNNLEVIQVSLRSYRNYLEEAVGKLRDSNVDFLKACRLFSEGGNFSSEEVQSFSKHLQKESERINSFEKLIMADMEKMESSCLEQATELINQAETKFRYLFMNRVFMEKIRQLLSNLQLQIKSEVQTETSHSFKGIIMNILWTGNNNLLCLAEEFYQKEKRQMPMPEDIPETFEHCVEMFGQNLLSYQSQTDDYYNSCLKEFQDQLKLFEEELPYVSQLAVDSLLKEHEQKLSNSTGNIRHLFNKQLEDWESMKRRSNYQRNSSHLYPMSQQGCAIECAQNFVSALAAFTEKLLLELDESITIDDIQVPNSEIPREKTSVLIRRKEAGLPLEICKVEQLIERGSRTWPGIPMTTLTDNSDYIICKETASVTTAKTTLGHVAAVEARDAVYKVGLWERTVMECRKHGWCQKLNAFQHHNSKSS
uniref:Coiled-coil domain containing 180 n=1 Tax=Anas zonorhyncha TaxID=75864 RepID=A0A8B9VAH0_9AVES